MENKKRFKRFVNLIEKRPILLAYYSDDLTGAADSLEALVLAGVPTMLFIGELPDNYTLSIPPDIQAVGVAGVSRMMTPEAMECELSIAFSKLRELEPKIVHYKICSTFDSSPAIGSIGKVAEIALDIYSNRTIPVVVGTPELKRYVVFGNLFAMLDGVIYRIDRHPIMKNHPITPMSESDLRIHLSRQTDKPIVLVDLNHLNTYSEAQIRAQFIPECEDEQLLLFDTVSREHLNKISEMIWNAGREEPFFVIGSSGIEFGLTKYWESIGANFQPQSLPSPGRVDQTLVVSGSASSWTAEQICWALQNGYDGIPINCLAVLDPGLRHVEHDKVVNEALDNLDNGKSVLIYSALGPDDSVLMSVREEQQFLGLSNEQIGKIIAYQLSLILMNILKSSEMRRICIAGGDTGTTAMRKMEVFGLEYLCPLGQSAPLCRTRSRLPEFDGLEIALKGGQLGDLDYFGSLKAGLSDLEE